MGGIHPAENKTANTDIEIHPLPLTASVPLSQHIGAPAKAIVARGEKVFRGQLIAQAAGFVSANIYAPVSGTVASVDNAILADGRPAAAIVIKASQEEHDADTAAREEYWKKVSDGSLDNMSVSPEAAEIRAAVEKAGIVGLGGATFPTHVKLSVKGTAPDTLIINGCECEPYLTCDEALMLRYGKYIAHGAALLAKAVGALTTVIAIEDNKPRAIAEMKAAASAFKGMKVVAVRTKYPQGGEKQLIAAITGRRVPSGAIPASVGVVVDNVATAFATWQAVVTLAPVTERVLTVTGDIPAAQQRNYLCAVGTPLSELPFTMPENPQIILGGPMMGRCAVNISAPVTKGTSGLLLLEARREPDILPCVRCGACVEACPMGLEPYLLAVYGKLRRWDDARNADVADCLECGCCSYSCPSHRPILDFIRIAKKRSRK